MSGIRRIAAFTFDHVRMVQWFMLCRLSGILLSSIVLARFLPISEVGVFELLMFCGYLMTFFWSDALVKGYLTKRNDQARIKEASAFVWLSFLIGTLFMGLLVVGGELFIPVFTNRSSLEGLQLFAVYQALIIPVWIAPFLGAIRNRTILLMCFFVLAGPSFACWFGFAGIPDLRGVLIGLLSYALVGFVWILSSMPVSGRLNIRTVLSGVWPVTWPLILYTVSIAIARSFDSWLVARHFDESTFAIFRYGAREFPLVVALAAGLSTSMISKLLKPDGVAELLTRTKRLMHICFPIVALLMLCSNPLFVFFFGSAYKASALIFNIYLLLTLTQLVFPQTILTARGDTKMLWYISLLELLVNVTASLILLRYFGLIGIVWGTLIAFVFEKAVLLIIVERRYHIRMADVFPVQTWLAYTMLIVFTFITAVWIFGV